MAKKFNCSVMFEGKVVGTRKATRPYTHAAVYINNKTGQAHPISYHSSHQLASKAIQTFLIIQKGETDARDMHVLPVVSEEVVPRTKKPSIEKLYDEEAKARFEAARQAAWAELNHKLASIDEAEKAYFNK